MQRLITQRVFGAARPVGVGARQDRRRIAAVAEAARIVHGSSAAADIAYLKRMDKSRLSRAVLALMHGGQQLLPRLNAESTNEAMIAGGLPHI